MVLESHQTGTLEIPRQARWLIAGLAIASLLIGLVWVQSWVRYPGAERQAMGQFQVKSQYQTTDDLPKVLRWYAQHFGLGHEISQGDNCVLLTGKQAYLFLQQSLAVTLCDQSPRTLIFVDRSLALR